MEFGIVHMAYILAALLFIMALAGLSKQETAKMGCFSGMVGMTIALLATFAQVETPTGFILIIVAMAIGAGIGIYVARKVVMTQMPELIACLHSFVGLAAVLVGYNTFLELGAVAPETVTIPEDEEPSEEEQKAEEEKTRETEQKLDSLSYEEMLASMYSLADEAKKSVATVSRVSGGTDWTDETTGIEDSAAGIVTADNGQELLIFAPDSVCSDAESWIVTFADGSRYGASLKMRDRNRCLAVFSVRRREISTSTWSSVKVAVLGNSNLTQQGDPVIALGNTFSYADGISYGIISSTDYKETFYDGECDILATDISAASGGSGVLFNMQGEVVGLIMASIWEDEGTNTANAYAISDLKSVIELMANGQNVPYIGVYATTVTSRLKEDQGMPAGIYVIDVDPDSPAMAAGIQSGDIICEINGETVTNLVTFEKAVLETRTDQQIQIKGKRLGADGYVDVDYTVTVGQK